MCVYFCVFGGGIELFSLTSRVQYPNQTQIWATIDLSDPRLPNASISNGAFMIDPSLGLRFGPTDGTGQPVVAHTVKARLLTNGGVWGPLSTVEYTFDAVNNVAVLPLVQWNGNSRDFWLIGTNAAGAAVFEQQVEVLFTPPPTAPLTVFFQVSNPGLSISAATPFIASFLKSGGQIAALSVPVGSPVGAFVISSPVPITSDTIFTLMPTSYAYVLDSHSKFSMVALPASASLTATPPSTLAPAPSPPTPLPDFQFPTFPAVSTPTPPSSQNNTNGPSSSFPLGSDGITSSTVQHLSLILTTVVGACLAIAFL